MKTIKAFSLLLLALVLVLSSAAPAAAEEAEAEYEEKTILYTFDGEEGLMLEESELADTFLTGIVRGANGDAQIEDDGTALLKSYASFYLDTDIAYDYFSGAYTFSLDYQYSSTNPSLGGIFVRMNDPDAYTVTNPKNAGTQQTFGLFEWDWYGENGGTEKGVSSVGGSGIRVYDNKPGKKLGVCVKTRVEDGLFVHAQGVEFDYPEGFNAAGMNNYRFVDDGKGKVEIYVNGVLLASVEYGGEKGTYPDGDEADSEVLYYKHAAVKDASGTQVLELDNARISAEYSTVGVGNRGDAASTTLDNVTLTYLQKKKAATPVPTEAPATDAPTEASAGGATQVPVNSPKSGDSRKTGGSNFTWLYVVCGVVAVAAVGVIVAFSLKGKKKK